METVSNKRILSGVQPSGILHIGNYFGAIRQHIRLQEKNECYYFVANFHSLNSVQDPERLTQMSL
ncbi:MAG: tryptophan--tRNA ligase, partial [Calditrichaeota bacterium]|nr:tryptophan--tRNA ligase [Calditrichota bacterium]